MKGCLVLILGQAPSDSTEVSAIAVRAFNARR